MAILSKGHNFSSGDNVTATKLDDLVDQATFVGGSGGATDNSTLEVNDGVGGDGSLRVKDLGITTAKLADGAVSTQKIADGAVTADKIAPSAASAIMPVGGVMPYAGATSPTGWLLCSGQTIGDVGSGATSESADYEDLFNLVKSYYGNAGTEVWASGNTVKLPDLRGRVIAGQDDMGGTSANRLTDQSGGLNGDTLGDTGGSETHTLTSAQSGMPSHNVSVAIPAGGSYDGGNPFRLTQSPTDNGNSTVTASVSGVDATSAHNNVQPTIILNYIIKY